MDGDPKRGCEYPDCLVSGVSQDRLMDSVCGWNVKIQRF